MRKLLPVLLALAACGQPVRTAAPVRAEVSVETAQAVVKAGVLRASDLPGYRVDRGGAEDSGPEGGTCLNDGSGNPVASDTASYRKGSVSLLSGVAVAPSTAALRDALTFLRGEFEDCYERVLNAGFGANDLTVLGYRSKPVSVRVPGADTAFGYEIRFSLRDGRDDRPVALRAYAVGAATGHALLLLTVFGRPGEAPGRDRLTPLLAKAVKRAAAAAR